MLVWHHRESFCLSTRLQGLELFLNQIYVFGITLQLACFRIQRWHHFCLNKLAQLLLLLQKEHQILKGVEHRIVRWETC